MYWIFFQTNNFQLTTKLYKEKSSHVENFPVCYHVFGNFLAV